MDENGEEQVDICAETGLFLGNTLFLYRMINRYTWGRRDARSGQKEYDQLQNSGSET